MLVAIWLVCLWLAHRDQDLAYLGAATIWLVGALSWLAITRWAQERTRVGDAYIQQIGLGAALARLLLRTNNPEIVWDRAQALQQSPILVCHLASPGGDDTNRPQDSSKLD